MITDDKKMFTLLIALCAISSQALSSAKRTCGSEVDCIIPDEECRNGFCECVPGLAFENDACQSVPSQKEINSYNCTEDFDCPSHPYSECDGSYCKCMDDAFESSPGICKHECSIQAMTLHDMERRIHSYIGAVGEPVLTDHKLKEGWFSLGQRRLYSSATGLMPGRCGSYHQIIIKGETIVDWPNLDISEVIVPVTVLSAKPGFNEDLEIRVRKCMDDLQYYLKPPITRFAAYCFESTQEEPEATENEEPFIMPSSDHVYMSYVYIQSTLRFYDDYEDGILINRPYVLWHCQWQHYREANEFMDGAEFVIVSWFANNERIRSFGPRQLIDAQYVGTSEIWTEAELTEMELLDAGYSMGAVLTCGVQFSRSEYGRRSATFRVTTSSDIFPPGHTLYMSLNNDNNIMQDSGTVPLGCATPVGSLEETCNLKMDVIRNDGSPACSDINIEGDNTHDLCGVNVIGLTKTGSEMNKNHWDYVNKYESFSNGTYFHEYFGTHFKMDSSAEKLEPGANAFVSMAVLENYSGHRLWDGYTVRNMKVSVSEETFQGMWHYSCNINEMGLPNEERGLNVSVRAWSNMDHVEKIIPVKEAGKYLMLRGGHFPFSFEVEIEDTNETARVCGGMLRYGNDVYIYSFCGGVFLEGLVAGDGNYIPEIITYGSIYIEEYDLYVHFNTLDRQLYIRVDRYTSPDIGDGFEGVCAVEKDGMTGRDGNRYYDEEGFLNTWRIYDDESLTNPINWVQYKITSKYYTCGCPAKTDNVPNRVVVYEDEWHSSHHVYTGVVHCQLDDYCVEKKEGFDWKQTLLPDYLIDHVAVDIEEVVDLSDEPVLSFLCQFIAAPGYYYKVKWYIDDVLFKDVEPDLATNKDAFAITDDEIYHRNSKFDLDMKIQCSVSVLESADPSGEVLISPILSDGFYPLEVFSHNVTLARGGAAVVSWRNNIPFHCTGGNDCDMEIKLFDPSPNAYDCDDSTVAIVSEDNCGGKIQATSTSAAVKGTDASTVITTKNNDKYQLKERFELTIVITFHGAGKHFWRGVLRHTIYVLIQDDSIWIGQSCHMHVDPHMRNFDGRYFENQNIGFFHLARHRLLPIEVQVRTKSCWDWDFYWAPTCACAILVRAGRDIYLIDHCEEGKHITSFISSGDKILEVYETSETRFKFILPNTMTIDVSVFHYFNNLMNIDIYPPPSEKNSMDGLCGNFNGDNSDDFLIRDTSDVGNNDEFSLSWGNLDSEKWSESLLNPDNYKNPTPWNTERKLCVCPNAATKFDNLPLCAVHEEATCTKQKTHKGLRKDIETRHKRDANHLSLDIERRLERSRTHLFNQRATKRKKRSVGSTNNMTEPEALRLCEDAFNKSCPISNIPGKPVNSTAYIEDCAKDLVAGADLTWIGPHCDSFTTRTQTEIDRDVVYASENAQTASVIEKVCVGGCYGHGDCIDGVCKCYNGWASDNCLINMTKAPEITYITGDGLCDLSNPDDGNCDSLIAESNGFTKTVFSRIIIFEAGLDGIFNQTDTITRIATYHSFYEVIIDVTGGRRRRSTSGQVVLAHQYGVSVSNDGNNYGHATYVTVLDTTCQEKANDTDGNTVVLLKAGFCYINGMCYSEGTASSTSSCNLCRRANNRFDWTEENCPTEASPKTDSDEIPVIIIIIGSVVGTLAIVFIAGIVYKLLSHKASVTPRSPAPPYFSPRQDGPMNLRYYINQVVVPDADAEKGKVTI